MDYVLAVKSGGYGSQSSYLAYQTAEALLAAGHTLRQVFFFQEGTTNANRWIDPASDEFNLLKAWQDLAKEQAIPLHLCIAAAQRRGIVADSVADHFTLAGLGEFSQAVFQADRLLTF